MKKKLIIFGTTELGVLAHFYFSNDSNYEVIAFTLDEKYITQNSFMGLPVLPFETIEKTYDPSTYEMFIAIGYTKLNEPRKNKYFEARQKGYTLASYVSSKSTSWPGLEVGENTFIMEDNTIMPFCKIGNNVLVWVNSILAHHMIINDHVTITSHCAIGGKVVIEEQAFVGLNATIRNDLTVGKGAVIATCTNVVSNVPEYSVMIGNPAKPTGKDSRLLDL